MARLSCANAVIVLLLWQLLSGAFRMSYVPLALALFLTMIGVLMLGTLMYYAERGTWDDLRAEYVIPGGNSR